jgi:hypothetical protein
MMQKLGGKWVLVAALPLTLVTLWAHAGEKRANDVTIVIASRYAWGAMGTVRNSGDSAQSIGCGIDAKAAGGSDVVCVAHNKTGVYASCSSTSQTLINAVSALNGDSCLVFYWDAAGNCTEIDTGSWSYYAPKNP